MNRFSMIRTNHFGVNFLAVAAFGLLAGSGQAQYRNIMISGPSDSESPNEPAIVVNPNLLMSQISTAYRVKPKASTTCSNQSKMGPKCP